MQQVISFNSYDNQRSRLTGGVTNKGLPYIQLNEIFDAYIGYTKIEKGAKVFNNDVQIFIPLSPENAVELSRMVELLDFNSDKEDYSDISLLTDNGRFEITLGVTESEEYEGIIVPYISIVDQSNNNLELSHIFNIRQINVGDDSEIISTKFEVFANFLKAAKEFSFNLNRHYVSLETNDSSESSSYKPGGKSLPKRPVGSKSKLGAGKKLSSGNKLASKKQVTPDDVSNILDDDDDI